MRKVRWLMAFGVTSVVCVVSLWISGAFILPLWVKSDTNCWVIASSIGVALAAVAALWGKTFAQSENKETNDPSGSDEHSRASLPTGIQLKAKAEGDSRIYQSGGDQTINDR